MGDAFHRLGLGFWVGSVPGTDDDSMRRRPMASKSEIDSHREGVHWRNLLAWWRHRVLLTPFEPFDAQQSYLDN